MSIRPSAFSARGRFWRGNLHTHSTLSDGALPPGEVCRRYEAEGYDFICLSDHLVGRYGYPIADTTAFRSNGFTTILGAEVHADRLLNGEIWHLVAVGLPPDFERPDVPDFRGERTGESIESLAGRCVDAGAYVAIAHPQWYGLTLADARRIEAAHAVEIYNHVSAVECDRGDGTAVLDLLLSEGRRLSACAADDAHFTGPDHFGGWVMVKAEELDPAALVRALRAGEYYSTQGPRLHDLRVEGGEIVVESSPVDRVVGVGARCASAVRHGTGMVAASLPLEPFAEGGWVRVTVSDAYGRRAWANPVWLD
jgi:PHP domain